MKRTRSIRDVLEEVEELIGTHFLDEFSKTRSLTYLRKVMDNQGLIEIYILAKTENSELFSKKH